MKTLVLGGVKSGKTRFAEQFAEELSADCAGKVVVATGHALDAAMSARIERHKAIRNPLWLTLEEPLHLAAASQVAATQADVIVVDCLTLWLTNLLLADSDGQFQRELASFEASLQGLNKDLVMVSNLVRGLVPLN